MGTSRTAAPQVRIDRGAELLAIKGARDRFEAAQGPSNHTHAMKHVHALMTHACGLMQGSSINPCWRPQVMRAKACITPCHPWALTVPNVYLQEQGLGR